jgi:hypothetical protein
MEFLFTRGGFAAALLGIWLAGPASPVKAAPVGLFENHNDIGLTRHAGSVELDDARQAYTIAGGGANCGSERCVSLCLEKAGGR